MRKVLMVIPGRGSGCRLSVEYHDILMCDISRSVRFQHQCLWLHVDFPINLVTVETWVGMQKHSGSTCED